MAVTQMIPAIMSSTAYCPPYVFSSSEKPCTQYGAMTSRSRAQATVAAPQAFLLPRQPSSRPAGPGRPVYTAQTGLSAAKIDAAHEPAVVLGELDRRCIAGRRYLFVAQHAVTEANIVYNERGFCPRMAGIDYVDTVLSAERIVPGLRNYQLDTLLDHFSTQRRADGMSEFTDLAALTRLAGRTARGRFTKIYFS